MSNHILLPAEFLNHTETVMGAERFNRFLSAMDEEPPVSIRLNPKKVHPLSTEPCAQNDEPCTMNYALTQVPWCQYGLYLPHRPNFTFDPLLHAGCYYVQEAASQFVVHCLQYVMENILSQQTAGAGPCTLHFALDLCAAPGGKSTALRTALPEDCLLVSNEPVRQRAQVLSENMQKWGYDGCVVTNNYPRDFARNGFQQLFDLVLCDVPCSGEGMFRKDPAAISEWSQQGVERCQRLQRQIVADIWPCLRDDGIMIYSTCTFNTRENEENVLWIKERLDADIVEVPVREEWGICGSLLPALAAPVCRFIPGLTRSEGLFVAVLRKRGEGMAAQGKKTAAKVKAALARMNVLAPTAAEPLSVSLDRGRYPIVELAFSTAVSYLRREAIVLPPETPRGQVIVSFRGHPLGFAKNIGNRANNLYPKEWAIRTTYIPAEYEPVLA